jgi:hypothetical protein
MGATTFARCTETATEAAAAAATRLREGDGAEARMSRRSIAEGMRRSGRCSPAKMRRKSEAAVFRMESGEDGRTANCWAKVSARSAAKAALVGLERRCGSSAVASARRDVSGEGWLWTALRCVCEKGDWNSGTGSVMKSGWNARWGSSAAEKDGDDVWRPGAPGCAAPGRLGGMARRDGVVLEAGAEADTALGSRGLMPWSRSNSSREARERTRAAAKRNGTRNEQEIDVVGAQPRRV